VASHDLQEPLRKIITFANIINDTLSDNSTEIAARYIEKILSASSRMRNLIHDILSYSRLSQDDNILKLTNLKLLIEEVQEDFELVLEEKKAKIIIHDLPEIEVNRGQMRQVFQNLISNSLKFSDKKRSPLITIKSERIGEPTFESRVREDGNYYRLTIQDNGIGFDEQYASGIFALFHRLHSKDSFEGTGIGLAITKKIIEKHKGLIMAKSKAGAGSSFIFYFARFPKYLIFVFEAMSVKKLLWLMMMLMMYFYVGVNKQHPVFHYYLRRKTEQKLSVYLQTVTHGHADLPDLILLDQNMPRMTGLQT
jgi:two-component system CheB/CheR fusion protein